MITVIMPAFKSEKTISRSLDSVRANSPGAHIIVVVDGPGDPTEAVVRARGDVEVVVNERNLGSGATRNRGLVAVKTEFVTSLDADDYIEGPVHQGMVEALKKSGADMVFTPWSWERGLQRSDFGTDRIKPIQNDQDALVEDWMGLESYVNGAVAWRTESLRGVGGWREGMRRGDDYELGTRCLVRGLRTTWSDKGRMVYVHHDSPTRVTNSKWSQAMADYRALFDMIGEYAAKSPKGEQIRRALGRRQYHLASHAYRYGDQEAGAEFIALARKNGFRGHEGSFPHRLVCSVFGLSGKQRMSVASEPIKQMLRGRAR